MYLPTNKIADTALRMLPLSSKLLKFLLHPYRKPFVPFQHRERHHGAFESAPNDQEMGFNECQYGADPLAQHRSAQIARFHFGSSPLTSNNNQPDFHIDQPHFDRETATSMTPMHLVVIMVLKSCTNENLVLSLE